MTDHDRAELTAPATTEQPAEGDNLRQQGARGIKSLALREGFGVLIRFGGALLLAKLLHDANFGVYSTAIANVALLTSVAQLSSEIQLIRHEQEPDSKAYHRAFTLVLINSAVITTLALLVALVAGLRSGNVGVWGPVAIIMASIPANALWAPAQAILERRLSFTQIAVLELGGDLLLYAVALGLVLSGAGLWGAAIAVLVWQLFILLGSYRLSGYRPRLVADAETLQMAKAGWRLSLFQWLLLALDAISLNVVTLLLGKAAAGQAALAIRLVAAANVVVRATYRLSLSVLSRAQDDLKRLYRAATEGHALQLLAAGGMLWGVAFLGGPAIKLIYKSQWPQWHNSAQVLPLVACSALLLAAATVPRNLLLITKREQAASRALVPAIITLIVVAAALAPHLKLIGWGIALVASSATQLVLTLRLVPNLGWRPTALWLCMMVPPLFFSWLQWPMNLLLFVPLLVLAATPAGRGQLQLVRRSLMALRSR